MDILEEIIPANVFFLADKLIVCDSSCKTCIGEYDNNCKTCRRDDRVMHQYKCIPQCPTHFFEVKRVCYGFFLIYHNIECHKACKDCYNATISGCKNCYSPNLLWEGTCVPFCPEKSFPYTEGGICLPCESPCETCTSAEDCIKCRPGFYLVEGTTKCVTSDQCPDFLLRFSENGP